MKIVISAIFLKFIFNILKNYMAFTMIDPFFPERMKFGKVEKLAATLHD